MPFPRPWTIVPTGPNECMVADKDGRKLFYIIGDEGDADGIEPSVLFHSEESGDLGVAIERCLTQESA